MLLILSGCSHQPQDFIFPNQTLTAEAELALQQQRIVKAAATELVKDESGHDILKVNIYGFDILNDSSELSIQQVTKDSLAERAQMQVGDRVKTIQGKDTRQYTDKDFVVLRDIFNTVDPLEMTIVRDDASWLVYFQPPFAYDIDRDFPEERLSYVGSNNPYLSQLVITNEANEHISSFSFIDELAFLPQVHLFRPTSLREENFLDLDNDGISELKIELTLSDQQIDVKKKEKPTEEQTQVVLLFWEEEHWRVLNILNEENKIFPALFTMSKTEQEIQQVEFIDFDKNSTMELVVWEATFVNPQTKNKEVAVNAAVYQGNTDVKKYRYQKVLSGEFQRQKIIELINP